MFRRKLGVKISYLLSVIFDCFLELLLFFFLFLSLLFQMNDFLIELHDLMVEFFFLFIAVCILLLLIELFKKPDLGIQLVNGSILFLYLVFETINLISVQILKFVLELIELFSKNSILFYLVLELLFSNLVPRVTSSVFFFSGFVLNFLQN